MGTTKVDTISPGEISQMVNYNFSSWRDVHMKRAGGFVPAWRNIPKSHSSSILEVESASSIGSWTNSPHTMGNGKIHFVGVVMQGKMYQVVLYFLDVYVHRKNIREKQLFRT